MEAFLLILLILYIRDIFHKGANGAFDGIGALAVST